MGNEIKLKRKYWMPGYVKQHKKTSHTKGDNQPGRVFKDPQGKLHTVVPKGRKYRRPEQPPGMPRGKKQDPRFILKDER